MDRDLRHPECGTCIGFYSPASQPLESLSLRYGTAGTWRRLDSWPGPFQTTPKLQNPATPNSGLNRCETRSPAQRSDSVFSIPL
jgi:hypothetical protein